MKRSKIVFLIFAIAFIICMVLIGLDISKRTTFPGSKGNLKERIAPKDSVPPGTKK